MNNDIPREQYPTGVMHNLIRDALLEVQKNLQAPDALIGSSFLTAMSIASQGDIDVELPTGRIRPVALFLATIADSGERKTAVDSLVCAPFYDYDEQTKKTYDASLLQYQADLRFWKAVDTAIQRKIVKAINANEDVDQLKGELVAHSLEKPCKPERNRIIYQSVTERPFMDALQGDGKQIAILSDEGEVILKGGAMNRLGVLNKAWDGAKNIAFDRADGSIEVSNPRVTLSFMVQQEVFADFMSKRGELARATGHWARYLVAFPTSTQGFRWMSLQEPVWTHLVKFHQRVIDLLEAANTRRLSGDVSRRRLVFSPEAKELYVHVQNYVEPQLKPGGPLSRVRDFASKCLEISGRVAAIFHHFSGQEGNIISRETFQRAVDVVRWHLSEAMRLFGSSDEMSQDLKDVINLRLYLHRQYWTNGFAQAPRNDVRKFGPIRHQGRFETSLSLLCGDGSVWIPYEGKRKRFIHMNPVVFNQIHYRLS
jgi:hypothetical protein